MTTSVIWLPNPGATLRPSSPDLPSSPEPSSSPDRCIRLVVDTTESKSSVPEISLALTTDAQEITVSTEWQESSKESIGVGFLDLPREIRDMVYAQVCAGLRRDGIRWWQTAPPLATRESKAQEEETRAPLEDEKDEKDEEDVGSSVAYADCAIMRTCRQVHAEFAEVVYSTPLQLNDVEPGINLIKFPPLYASLVRSVLVVRTISLRQIDNQSDKEWRELLQSATSISKVFPNTTTLRVGWCHGAKGYERWFTKWNGKNQNVQIVEKTIRRVKGQANSPIIVPHQMELVQLVGPGKDWEDFGSTKNVVHPAFAEAVRNSRSKPKSKGMQNQKAYIRETQERKQKAKSCT
ncbi:uncharacterized protein K460DRAFT_370074 [Cucurbitaria berberidis CBS 394.84]|uniref:Uncharacterized protein n=1 Tax=Cucurbitaria berberidis CBS 394.84 TaxID=1168544 RepID=A0A9P4L4K9_9PLEO|nr:uncharacterized protein K460DRAFT_370074 [Cucurbitaria berberidis CBS 394.84]KAF1842076.1 hypothetical protein K460DRAFT_370074 [Cucurbitaria berberidis CBS 394.84]